MAAEVEKERRQEGRVTTDPDEGRRQIEAMQLRFKVGDMVRLKAGGDRVMTVVLDYGDGLVCDWHVTQDGLDEVHRETFPAAALVKVEQ